ncbi:hypothetical protein [Aquimarina pacifica]|uniref:hypothetical protein n=1 Tax=Aquimarina pacifica TaxID=1296415 RepID=UPI000471EB49|nr:hypothetical protein [Aquimarina pacifica]
MGRNTYKNIISLFFVLTFLLLRIVNLHAFSHFSNDDEQIHCELCDIITISHKIVPFASNTPVALVQETVLDTQDHRTDFFYETGGYSITLPKSIHNKPPPAKIGYGFTV